MTEILTSAPWWAYTLLAYLLFMGYQISKPRTINISRIFFLPTVLLVLSFIVAIRSGFILSNILGTYGMDAAILSKWFWVLAGSFFIGVVENRKILVKKGSLHYQLISTGGWLTPFIILAMFATKYYLSYSIATSPTKELLLSNLLASQFIAGYLLGRSLSLGLKCYRKSVVA